MLTYNVCVCIYISTYVRKAVIPVLVKGRRCKGENANSARGVLQKWRRVRGANIKLCFVVLFGGLHIYKQKRCARGSRNAFSQTLSRISEV